MPNLWKDWMITKVLTYKLANERFFHMFGISPAFVVYSYTVWDILVSVPDPKPTPAQIAFSIAHSVSFSHALYWKRYAYRMRSGDETRDILY